jgi:hypothetical protein
MLPSSPCRARRSQQVGAEQGIEQTDSDRTRDYSEQKVEDLASLPSRVSALELQIVQLRNEMRVEFSAVRRELAGTAESLGESLRAEIRQGDEETRREMRELNDEALRYMRVLHEEVIARIAALGDARG